MKKDPNWYQVHGAGRIDTPALLLYPERIRYNIAQMVRIAGTADRLRPHVKTHKMAEIIQMQQAAGIRQFKCATLAEAELLARCGVVDVLVAYPLTGTGPGRLAGLQERYPETRFSTLVDHETTLEALEKAAGKAGIRLAAFLDLNVGMDRTGITPGPGAAALYRKMAGSTYLEARGLHAYDGHLRNPDPEQRARDCDQAFSPVACLAKDLRENGLQVDTIVAGGSPTFQIHARREGVQLSPGTTLLWDARYGQEFPEMPFEPAAVLLARVISKPAPNTLCLDLGHKAVAAEMPFPRVWLTQIPDNRQVGQSEEHLVLQTQNAAAFDIGAEVYAMPMHICPTVIKYPKALLVQEGKVMGSWKVAARDYHLPD
jgi:D-serine deaminase-like pyridoxal phosphate-dependent protein